MKITKLLLLVIAIPLLAAGCNAQTAPEVMPTPMEEQSSINANEVIIENFNYGPAEVVVKKGTTITWTNKDSAGHTVTATGDNGPKSNLFGQGETYSYTFDEVGTFEYFCEPHPYMKGVIKVE